MAMDPARLGDMRLQLEQSYMNKWRPGHRIRKDRGQMDILMDYFNKDPNWTFETKMEIASRIDMTPN